MATIHVDVVSAEESIFSGEAKFVALPGEMGELGIYPRHTPLITRIKAGSVRIEMANGTEEFVFVAGGLLEVQPNCVTVLSDTAVRGKDLDDEKANAAKQAAEEALKNAKGELDIAIPATSRGDEIGAMARAVEVFRDNARETDGTAWNVIVFEGFQFHRVHIGTRENLMRCRMDLIEVGGADETLNHRDVRTVRRIEGEAFREDREQSGIDRFGMPEHRDVRLQQDVDGRD